MAFFFLFQKLLPWRKTKDGLIHEKFVDSGFVKTCDELVIDATNIAGSAILP